MKHAIAPAEDELVAARDRNREERGAEPLKLALGPACPGCEAWLGRPSARLGYCVCLACGAAWRASEDERATAEGAEIFDTLRGLRAVRLPHEDRSRSGGYRCGKK